MIIEKRADLPRSSSGPQPVGFALDAVVKSLRAPLNLDRPRKLDPEKAK